MAAAGADPLEHLLAFSSIAGVLGTPGQGSYAAANASLDAVAAGVALAGWPCRSVQWGAWSGAGMAASSPQLLAKLARQGYAAIAPAHGLQALAHMLLGSKPAVVMAAPFIWARFLAAANRSQLPFFADVRHGSEPEAAPLPPPTSLPAAAPAAADATSLVAGVLALVQQLAEDLAGPAAAGVPFLEAGLDSIGAVELRCGPALSRSSPPPARLASPPPPHLPQECAG